MTYPFPVQPSDPAVPQERFRSRYREARSRLGGAQKSAVGVPAYLRFVNRKAGGWLASVGYGLRATPNQLTAASAVWSWAGIVVLATAKPSVAVAVGVTVALLVGFAFDSADGQLSRVRGGGGPAGEWLDHVVDVAKIASLHAAVAVSLTRYPGPLGPRWALVPLGFGIVQVTFFFAMMLRDQLGARPVRGAGPAGAGSVLRSFVLLPMDYGTQCLLFLAWAHRPTFAGLYGALFLVTTVFTVRSLGKAHGALLRA